MSEPPEKLKALIGHRTVKHGRVVVAILAILTASGCTMSDATYRAIFAHQPGPLVKDETHRPPPGQYGVVASIDYDCSRARNPRVMPEAMIDHQSQCPETAQVSGYDCVDHTGKEVPWRRCEDSRAPLLGFNPVLLQRCDIPFPYGRDNATARAALSEQTAAPYRVRRTARGAH